MFKSSSATSSMLLLLSCLLLLLSKIDLARSLSIEELAVLISTETSEEFDWSKENAAAAEKLWQDANAYEWAKAKAAESQRKYPYLLCHVDGVGGMSGYQRKLALLDAIENSSSNNVEETVQNIRPLYNEEDYLCVYGQLHASVASNLSEIDGIEVQPLVPSLKYMEGSVDRLRKEIEYQNDNSAGSFPTLDVVLCPGVEIASQKDAEPSVVDAIMDDSNANNTSSLEEWGAGVPEGSIPSQIVDILVPLKSALVSNQTDDIQQGLYNSMESASYLTSEEYISSATDEKLTSRAKLWKEAIDEYQSSGKCDDTYINRLDWTLIHATNNNSQKDGLSELTVKFNTTGNTEHDVGCMLLLELAIASHPDVCSLEVRERVQTQNKMVQWLSQSEIENERPFFDAGLNGEGQVVAVSDTGCDMDHCYFGDAENPPGRLSPNLSARKLVQYVPFVDFSDNQYGHGTHVSGTIAGNRLDGGGAAQGVAPHAKLAVADIGDMFGSLSLPFDSQLLATGRPEAKVHNGSWGSTINFYTTQAHNFDQYMYENDDFLIVMAGGNSGRGDIPNTIGAPATGKNLITVGAHHNYGSSLPDGSLGPNHVADFSSRGPTADGRMKPDILAAGKAVLSAGALPSVVGECDPSDGGIPDVGGSEYGLLSLQGTSMAAPVISGTAAIVRQYFEDGYYPTGTKNEADAVANPSGALIKAVLMNGAQFMGGVDNGGSGVTDIRPYDNNQGFGRMSLQDSLYLPSKTNIQLKVWDREVVNDQGTQSYNVKIDKSNGCTHETLSATLVWMEQGSMPGCMSCVLNDLDLTVEIGGKTNYPNNLQGPDRTNNAERVIVNVNDGDEAIITVTGQNLIDATQKYSLVTTGCFGGVANTMFEGQCSVFDCDNSRSNRIRNIMLIIFVPLGAIILMAGFSFWRKRNQGEGDGAASYGAENNQVDYEANEKKADFEANNQGN